MQLWDELLPRTELCLNHLIPYAPNPRVSAYAGLHGGAFDFFKNPIAPAGARVLIHEVTNNRASWAHHGILGFYLEPAKQHHRCFRLWSVTSKQTRISDTVAWFLDKIELPGRCNCSRSFPRCYPGFNDIATDPYTIAHSAHAQRSALTSTLSEHQKGPSSASHNL